MFDVTQLLVVLLSSALLPFAEICRHRIFQPVTTIVPAKILVLRRCLGKDPDDLVSIQKLFGGEFYTDKASLKLS